MSGQGMTSVMIATVGILVATACLFAGAIFNQGWLFTIGIILLPLSFLQGILVPRSQRPSALSGAAPGQRVPGQIPPPNTEPVTGTGIDDDEKKQGLAKDGH